MSDSYALSNEQATTRRLYLVRHAKSSHDNPDLIDFDRPLAKRGINDAPFMGKVLNKLRIKPDHIISSPAVRAKETARFFSEKVPFNFDEITWDSTVYTFDKSVLLKRITQIDDQFFDVMIFGHNNAMTDCANFLQNDTTLENVPTSAVVGIEFSVNSWADVDKIKGKFLFFEYPKKYKKK